MVMFPRSIRRYRTVIAASLVLMLCLVSAALAYSPDQASQGEDLYAKRCSTCHGNVGQGLTDEFRSTWVEGDQNCWRPGCHGGNPPKPDGFSLPRYVPALVGPGTLARFPNALALHTYITALMPMQEPGALSGEEYWALTAFLLRENGVAPDGVLLDEAAGADLPVPKSGQPTPRAREVATPGRISMQARRATAVALAAQTPRPQASQVAVARAPAVTDTAQGSSPVPQTEGQAVPERLWVPGRWVLVALVPLFIAVILVVAWERRERR